MTPLETYIRELHDIRSSGAAVKETSYYGPLANLLNEIGKSLKPKGKCIINSQNQISVLGDGGFSTFLSRLWIPIYGTFSCWVHENRICQRI